MTALATATTLQTFISQSRALAETQPLLSALHADAALHEAEHTGQREAVEIALQQTLQCYPHPFEHYQQLIHQAKEAALAARLHAHAPFSRFFVGAALISEQGQIVVGCNVESSSYGLTICAERTALVSAVAQGLKRFAAVVVAADTPVLTPPCGACRQMLYDFAPEAVVILVNPHGNERHFTMRELLPEAFSADFLH
jgi:cytidine deaminase